METWNFTAVLVKLMKTSLLPKKMRLKDMQAPPWAIHTNGNVFEVLQMMGIM